MPTVFGTKAAVLGALALALTVMVAIAIPTDTGASHDFNDVPTNLIFHEEVSRIKDAGITTGCGGGNYCPFDAVSRLAMAAFMNRGFGRAAMDNSLVQETITDADGGVKIGEVMIDVPGAGGSATQFVEVRGQVSVFDLDELVSCFLSCFVLAQLWDPAAETGSSVTADLSSSADTIELSWVFEASPEGPHTYEMYLQTSGATTDLTLFNLVLTATTYPFGAGGGDVLSPGSGSPTPTIFGEGLMDGALLDTLRTKGLADSPSHANVLEELRSRMR